MTDDMVVDAAYFQTTGLRVCYGAGEFEPVEECVAREILRDWRRREGSDRFVQLVELLRDGHEVASPLAPGFRYRSGGDAGRQERLL